MQRRTLILVALLLALIVATPALAQTYGVIPALGPWDGGPDRLLYCTGAADLWLHSEAEGAIRVACPTWTPTPFVSPLDTPTATVVAVPTITPSPTWVGTTPPPTYTATTTATPDAPPTGPPTATVTDTPEPLATATITATETATMTTFTNGYGGDVNTAQDTYVRSGSPGNVRNFGVDDALYVAAGEKALLYFDLSAIPADATCVSATLYVYMVVSGTANAGTVTAYAIASGNAGWIEGTKNNVTAGAGEPTWNALAADGAGGVTTAWAGSAGLSTSGTDYEATSIGSFSANKSDAVGTEYSAALTASRVEGWFGAGNTNYGLLLIPGANLGEHGSSDHATTGYRPKLVVTYTEAGTGITISDSIAVAEAVSASVAGGVVDLSIPVSDVITLSDVVSLALGDLNTAVVDALGVTESVDIQLTADAYVLDSVGLSDVPSTFITEATGLSVQVSDAVHVTDDSTGEPVGVTDIPDLDIPVDISVNDTVNLAETVDTQVSTDVYALDNVGLAEAVSILVTAADISAQVSDSISVSEAVALDIQLGLSVAEAVGVAESLNVAVIAVDALTVSASDGIGIADTPTLVVDMQVGVQEPILVSESLNTVIAEAGVFQVSVSDPIAVAEFTALSVPVNVTSSDPVTVNDQAIAFVTTGAAVTDAIGVTDEATVALGQIGQADASVTDSVTVQESVQLSISLNAVVADSISVTDQAQTTLIALIVVSELVGVTDQAGLDVGLGIVEQETIGVVDSPTPAVSAPQIGVIDNLSVVESVSIFHDLLPPVTQVSSSEGITVGEFIVLVILTSSGLCRVHPVTQRNRVTTVTSQNRVVAVQ